MDYTVKELLTLPEFQNAQYIGTKQSLAKNIRGITIIDSPDISLWLNGGGNFNQFLPDEELI